MSLGEQRRVAGDAASDSAVVFSGASSLNRGVDEAPITPASARRKPGSTRALVALLAFILGFATVPHRVCERGAARWLADDPDDVDALGKSVAASREQKLTPAFATGSSRFDGEWHFATHVMGALGFGQVVLARPEARAAHLAQMEACIRAMLEPSLRAFDERAWGHDAVASTDAPGAAADVGHVAYLGYAALVLALHRHLEPTSPWVGIEERFTAALARRIEASPVGLAETYPGEVYPVDNTAALAALAVHARATRQPPPAALRRGLDAIRTHGIDPTTGLVVQAVALETGKARDAPRASGTALGAYFLAFADLATSRDLYRALERRQFRTVLGFGGIMEYPEGHRRLRGDVDSGPVVLGFGVSASGFGLGASRIHGDRDMFTALFATAHLFGAPLDERGTRTYVTGGPIGDAILFAMLTAPRGGRLG